MQHPFTWLPGPARKYVFIILLILTIGVMIGLGIIDKQLTTDQVSSGIISFEFAGNPARTGKILDSWDKAGGTIYADLSLTLDFLYLVLYSAAISLGCTLLSGAFRIKKIVLLGMILAWCQFIAALCDCMENIALLNLLHRSTNSFLPTLAYACAAVKFTLISCGLAYVVIGGIGRLLVFCRKKIKD